MRIAVTGGFGFIGQATIAAGHAAGHDMLAVDRQALHLSGRWLGQADVTDYHTLNTALKAFGAEHVIHLAGKLGIAELFDDVHGAIDVNIHGSANVIQWCHANQAGYTGITMPPVFNSIYTATKVCADRLATAYHESMGLRTSRVVAFNAFGPAQAHGPGHPQKIIPMFATEAWNNRPIPIWGDGEQTVDLIDAADIGRMLVDATGYHNDETFDAGTGYPMTVNQVADYVIERTGSTAGIKYLPMRRGEKPTEIVAEGRGWELLGWSPKLEWDGLGAAVDAYRPADRGSAA